MIDINEEYQNIIKKCKFISKPDEWFVEGTEAKCSDTGSYSDYKQGDKFCNGWSFFEGYTNETHIGYSGELPRPDGDTSSFDEFYIYDEYGNEISKMTLDEYNQLIREQKLKRIIK